MHAFPGPPGEMADLIRRHDWRSTSIGPIETWPQSLRTTVSLLIAAPIPIVLLWGEDGVMIYNDAYSDFAGGRHPQLLGSKVREGWPEVAAFNDNVMNVGLGGGTLAYKDQELTLHRTGKPEQVWMDLDYWPVIDESGRPGGVIATVVETTARVQSDRLRAATNERLELALSAGRGVGTWDFDIDADRVVADDRFADIYGVDPELAREGAALSAFFQAMHPDDAERVGGEVQRTLETGAPFRSEYRLVQTDGRVRWVSAEGRIVTDTDGKRRFPGVTFDITDRHEADAALAETESRYEALFNTTSTGFCIVQMKFDADDRPIDYRIVEGNSAYEDMTGLKDSAGKWVSEIAPGLEQHWFDLYGRVALTGESVRFENPADTFGRWYDVEALRIGDPAQHRVAILFTNITERKRAEVRQAALIALDDAIMDLIDPVEIGFVASRILGDILEVQRAAYGVIDAKTETIVVERDWTRGEAPSVAGVHRFRSYGDYVADILTGQAAVIEDVAVDARIHDPGPLLTYGIRALMDVPIVESGVVVAQFLVHSAEPRAWSEDEVAYVRTFADRTHAAIARRLAEAARRESEARYRTLFDEMDEGFCIIEFFDGPHGPNSDYVHVEANPAYAANAGIENVVGQTLREMVGDEAQSWVDRYGEVLRTGQPIRFEQELVATGRWLNLSAFRIEPPERRQVAVLFQDLTDRRRAELALRDSETRYRSLFDTIDEGFCIIEMIFDPAGRPIDYLFLEVNPAFSRHTGLVGAVGRRMKFIAPDHEQHWFDIYGRVALTGEPIRFEEAAEALDRYYEVYAFRVGEPESHRVAVLFNDISTRRINELALKDLNATLEARVEERTRELSRAHEALRQSQKMEAVGQLTGGIAHDFNNLLAGISGALELLSKRLSEGRLNGIDRYIDAAQGSAKRAASLTQRLLAFSRRQTLDPKPTDVNRLVNGMEDLIRRSVGPDVEVEVVGAGGLWATRIDQPQLENALLNLCINGRDAMAPDGGRLTIETSNKWLDDRASKTRDLPPGQYVSLCVTDTGTGMPPEVQAQAFDPFFTTKPLGQGTGLGLSMIHGFVRQSGGQVRIYSEMGKGTTMCLYLPRYQGDVAGEEEVDPTALVDGGHGETVLIIDDEETVRRLVAEVLGEVGYTVIEAPDGPSGLEILRSDRRIDLLISDVGLPGGMNGRQVADAARVTRPELKVLFITGYAENAAVGNGLLATGMEVLTKPFVMGDLAAKVHDMIEG